MTWKPTVALDRPKDFGGLGFRDVRMMSTCLMCKWIDKLERGYDSILLWASKEKVSMLVEYI